LERLYADYGTWGVFASRFVPGARAVIPIFAGVAGLTWGRSLIPLAVGSAIWYGALTYVAATLLPKLDDIAGFVVHLNWVGLLLGVSVIALASWLIARSRKRAAALLSERLKQLAGRSASDSAATVRPEGNEASPPTGTPR
jgi:membrane protein DedA with SNARE-associated domain